MKRANTYLKEVFQFYRFLEQEYSQEAQSLKVLSDQQIVVRNSVGVRRILNRKGFHGYLQEKGHQGKTIEQGRDLGITASMHKLSGSSSAFIIS